MVTQPMGGHLTAIVLAGGRSLRFGRDKLAADAGGRTLLERVVDAIQAMDAIATPDRGIELLVVVGADGRPDDDRLGTVARVVRDTEPGRGPLAGLRDGLREAAGDRVLVVAGDMPTLRPDVLRLLAATLDDGAGGSGQEIEAAILSPAPAPAPAPAHPPVRPLPMALRRTPALDAATRLLAADRRSLRALLDELRTTSVPFETWRSLDPDGATFRDIDTPADLAALRASEQDPVDSGPARSSSG